MSTENQSGGLSVEDRQLVYARARISRDASRHIEGMVEGSPGRRPGKAALTNVVTRLHSRKNRATRVLESHTGELVFGYELELDPSVLGYYTQVPCRNVKRTLPNGRLHVSSGHVDFLVFRRESVELVECKPLDWLVNKAKEDNEWLLDGLQWRHVPTAAFAREHELRFSIWSPPEHPGVYLQNLEAMYATMQTEVDDFTKRVARKAAKRVGAGPASISELQGEVDGFGVKAALWMLAVGEAYGPLKSTPVQATDLFTICVDPEQAALIDKLALEATKAIYAQPTLSNPIFLASTTDLAKARLRMARVLAMRRGEIPWAVRMALLSRQMAKVEAEGGSALITCLTNYNRSGNRLPRLLPEQELAAMKVIDQLWNRGQVRTKKNLYFAYEIECAARGVTAGGRTSFYARVRREKPTKHALATGGLRGYQAVRPATDPSRRSLPPIGFGHTLFVDASGFDNRSAPELAKQMPAQKGKFYIGIDGSSQMTMAHALIFGPARTDGLAILLREYVRRWGRLPHIIHLDRGPENTSAWTSAFAEAYHISLRFSPTAGSAWNGLAESAIKRVNSYVAHELVGSTLPDQKGRGVDGRFKSYRNAKTRFEVARDQFLAYIHDDLPNTPGSDGLTPLQRQEEARNLLGDSGLPCPYDEDLLLATSVPMSLKRNVDKQRGVRTEEGYFTSDRLMDALRFHDVEEARSDCEDPTVLRLRLGGVWIKAFHSRVQTMALSTPGDKLFDLMFAPVRRSDARARKLQIDRIRYNRIQNANFATLAASNMPPEPETTLSVREGRTRALNDVSVAEGARWEEIEILPEQGKMP